MELLSQHDKQVENKIIQTRFRKRQENLFAMHNSPNSPLFRRQSLQIKREIASLETFTKKRSNSEKNTKKSTKNDEKMSPNKAENGMLKDTALENQCMISPVKSVPLPVYQGESLKLPQNNFDSNCDFVALSENIASTTATNKTKLAKTQGDQTLLKRKYNGVLSRRKRNIVPPVWYSVYVTNNFLFRKSSKAKNPENLKKDKIKDLQAERSIDEDLNRIVRNTNLQVVVERLEDTIKVARKTKNPLLDGYKIASKLKEDPQEHDLNQNTRSLHFSLSETVSKGQGLLLPQSHMSYCNTSRKVCAPTSELKEDMDEEINGSLLKASAVDPGNPNNEKLETGNSSAFINYSSPIKLMFLSEINSSEGVKYTLTSASDSSKSNADTGSTEQHTSATSEEQSDASKLVNEIPLEDCERSCNEKEDIKEKPNSVCAKVVAIHCTGNETKTNDCKQDEAIVEKSSNSNESTLKRKPGRPKKIGPQVVKQVKRPIGRPPKPKVDVAESTNSTSNSIAGKSTKSDGEGIGEGISNRNIIVTIVFGRSRRTKRCVSEGNINVVNAMPTSHGHSDFVNDSSELRQSTKTENSFAEIINSVQNSACDNQVSGSGYDYVKPIKSNPLLPHHCSNILRPNQKPLTVIRKPGRPAKVKISGISVTVNRISPRERKVSISSCLPPLEQENVFEKNISQEKNNQPCNKMDEPESLQNDLSKDQSGNRIDTIPQKNEIPLRHSVRDRRPSLNFLHSLASSNSFTCKSALLRNSYKHHLKKANQRKEKCKQSNMVTPSKDTSKS
uniref:Uncharacterized protein n=1 Tax=Sphenodon punctatus TaxID=8508 RepID=A0A8D0GP49_SPHPU